jgi:hypothetical protein
MRLGLSPVPLSTAPDQSFCRDESRTQVVVAGGTARHEAVKARLAMLCSRFGLDEPLFLSNIDGPIKAGCGGGEGEMGEHGGAEGHCFRWEQLWPRTSRWPWTCRPRRSTHRQPRLCA